MTDDEQWVFKVVIGGAGGVGKTALVQRCITGKFAEDHKMTIGAAFSVKDIQLENHTKVRLQIWDFAGEQRFRFLLSEYCLGASGALICYDITDYNTFEEVQEWLNIIRSQTKNIPIILVGLKYDLPTEKHEVTADVAEKYAEDAKCITNIFCSSKLNMNVEETFIALAKWLIYFNDGKC